MNKREQKHFEKRLQEELATLAKVLGKLEKSVMQRSQRDASGDLSAYSIHMADLGTDAMERERDLLLASAEGRTVLQIREALKRLEGGSFGTCENCGKPIGAARLEMIPYAVYCTKCQVKMEKSQ